MTRQVRSVLRHRGRLLGLAAVVFIVTAAWAASIAAADPNVVAIRALAVDTILVEHQIVIPAVASDAVVSQAEAARLNARAEVVARAHYAGQLLQSRIDTFKENIDSQVGQPPAYLDGGVKDVVMGKTTVEADSATVELRATTWLKVTQGGAVSTPMGAADYRFTFAKIDGKWFVTSEEFDFVDGAP